VGAAALALPRLQAEQVADYARAIEEGDTDRPLPKEPPGAAEVYYVHEGLLSGGC
jgi:hypothetical protein